MKKAGTLLLTCALLFGNAVGAAADETPLRREFRYRVGLEDEFGSVGVPVRNEDLDEGKADIRTSIKLFERRGRIRIEATMVLDNASVDDVEFVVNVEFVDLPRGISLWSKSEELEVDKSTEEKPKKTKGGFKRSISPRELEGTTHVVITHVPVEWRRPGENDPGRINEATGTTHIIIVPGLRGDTSRVKGIVKLLEDHPAVKDPKGGRISAQIWDWTRLWIKPRGFQSQILIKEQTRKMGMMLALRLAAWQAQEPPPLAEEVHIMGLSAGSLIVAAACDAKNGDEPILGEEFFGHVLFLSGVLSVRHDLTQIDRCSRGIYNYYSDKDNILTVAFPKIFLVFELPVSVSWPAVGRFGYSTKDHEYRHVTSQLPWLREEYGGRAHKFGNNGRHLKPGCLKEAYFREYILPLFTNSKLPKSPSEGEWWSKKLHPCYAQDQSHDITACVPRDTTPDDD